MRFLTEADLVQDVGQRVPIISLSNAALEEANLSGTDLRGVDFSATDLGGSDLKKADLSGADLTGADLTGVHMTAAERREAEQSATNIYLPVENKAKVRAWEAAARSSLKDVLAALKTCLATTHVEKWDPHVSPEAIRDTKVLRCTDSDSAFRYAEDELRLNVAWRMIPQTEQVGIVRENTGEVLVQVAHNEGGSAFQSSTAASGRTEHIPRGF